MNISDQRIVHDVFKYNIFRRVVSTAIGVAVTFFGINWLYDSIVSGEGNSQFAAIALIGIGVLYSISYNYFRLLLTETSLIQDGILWKKEVVFDTSLDLVSYGDRSFGLYNSEKKIEITYDLDRKLVLVEKLKAKIQKMHEEVT